MDHAPLVQVLLPRYVPRAGKETLLHLSFWAKAEKLKGAPAGVTGYRDTREDRLRW